jgi:hypothetical protein
MKTGAMHADTASKAPEGATLGTHRRRCNCRGRNPRLAAPAQEVHFRLKRAHRACGKASVAIILAAALTAALRRFGLRRARDLQ